MAATIEHRCSRSVLRLTTDTVRPVKSRRAYHAAYTRARVASGRCKDCGRQRRSFKWRCDRCQRRERKYWASRYPEGNWSWFLARRADYVQRARIRRFIEKLESQP
jgi:hypothetical protein